MNLTTLCYLERGGEYLMLHRICKKNDINRDKWIGIGGHFEGIESPEECLLREAREETGLTLTSYRFRGLVTFIPDEKTSEYMCLYTADGWEGEIGSLNLWEGDKIFMKLLKEEKPFFSLKLRYEGDLLKEAVLDGKEIPLPLGKEWE